MTAQPRRLVQSATLFFSVAISLSSAHGQCACDRIWTQPSMGLFGSPTNWNPPSVPTVGQTCCFGDLPSTSFDPVTVVFDASVTSGSHAVVSGAYTYQYVNPGLTVSLSGQNLRVGSSMGAFNSALASTARLTLEFDGQLTAGDLLIAVPECGNQVRTSTVEVQGPTTQINAAGTVRVGDGILHLRSGATLIANGSANIGETASGSLLMEGGATLTSGGGIAGHAEHVTGTISVSGAGTSWTSSGAIYLGASSLSVGEIIASAGGRITCPAIDVGQLGGSGTLTVSGAGSLWNTSSIAIGSGGTGHVRVLDGGTLIFSGFIAMGNGTESVGDLSVDNASTVTCAGDLRLGFGGAVAINVLGGSTFTTSGYAGVGEGSPAAISISGLGSRWTHTGYIDVRYGMVTVGPGARCEAGDILVDGRLAGAGTYDVEPSINGYGVANFDGSVAPGMGAADTGTLTIEGHYQQFDGIPEDGYPPGVLECEIAGADPGDVDRLVVTGEAYLGGRLAISRLGGYSPPIGSTFPIVAASSVLGQFSEVTGQFGLGGGRYFQVVYAPDAVHLVVDQITSISISPASSSLYLGFPQQLKARGVTTSGGIDITSGVTWTSDNPLVVSVDASGRARAESVGTTTIHALFDGYPASLEIQVLPLPGRWSPTRVSTATGNVEGNSDSYFGAVSANGRFVTFYSAASNLTGADTNDRQDVFVRDTATNQTERVSTDSAGSQANGNSFSPAISADGRYVAFESDASNLVPADTNGRRDVFLKDRSTGQTTRVSVGNADVQGDADSFEVSISDDGRLVAFASSATNLVPFDTNTRDDAFIYDRLTATTTRVHTDASGAEANGNVGLASISHNGRYLVFSSNASNLVPGDTNGRQDVFLKDVQSGAISRVNVSSTVAQTTSDSGIGAYAAQSRVSNDGRFVVFWSYDTLVPGASDLSRNVYVRDSHLGTTTLLNVNDAGVPGNQGAWEGDSAVITSNGRFTVFSSGSTNLIASDTNGAVDVFLHDLYTGKTRLLSGPFFGDLGDRRSGYPSISASGSQVTFESRATNLVPFDRNNKTDVFVRQICIADFNFNGVLSVQDIFDFLAAWFAGNPAADFQGSGTLSVQDIFDFLAGWFAGC